MNDDLILFSTEAYRPVAEAMCREGQISAGEYEVRYFPDGERYLRIRSEVDGRDVLVLGGTIGDADTLELFDLACGVVDDGARRLTLIVPYFGCSTMDRRIHPGEVVTAKTRAHLLSSIPPGAYNNRIFLVDLHSEGLPQYFEAGTRAVHLYARPIILQAARELGGDDFVLASTDAGRAKWVESLSNDLGVPASFVMKRRIDASTTKITAMHAHVLGRRVVIYDDMIRTGSSLLRAAEAYLGAGAKSVAAIATHGVFPGDALDRIRESGVLERIVVTDSHPRARALADGNFLEVRSIASVLVDALRRSP